jgi:hypothetical protein
MDIFLSAESAFPIVPTVQFAGTDITQLPSGFFTGFVSAAVASNPANNKQIIKKDLVIFPPQETVTLCAGELAQVNCHPQSAV